MNDKGDDAEIQPSKGSEEESTDKGAEDISTAKAKDILSAEVKEDDDYDYRRITNLCDQLIYAKCDFSIFPKN